MRTGIEQRGKFDIRQGMAFQMKDLNHILKDGRSYGAGVHPWLITKVEENYVEAVMCITLTGNGKHRMFKTDYDDIEDVVNHCPPMDPKSDHTSGINKGKFIMFPKKELFGHELKILNGNTKERNFATEGYDSLCMDKKSVRFIRSKCLEYSMSHPDIDIDPFGIQKVQEMLDDLEDGYPVPKGFSKDGFQKKYGWEHIEDADPNAVYPKEEEMAWYEKKDEKLLSIVRERDDELTLTDEDLRGIPGPGGFSL